MHLSRFAVKGFKNLVEEVTLEDLGRLNVLHGEHDAGKSNLLEALGLFFLLLSSRSADQWVAGPKRLAFGTLQGLGYSAREVFNLFDPRPINLRGTFCIEDSELKEAGISPLLSTQAVEIAVRLTRLQDACEMEFTRFRFADGTNGLAKDLPPDREAFALRVALFLLRRYLHDREKGATRFLHLRLDRGLQRADGRNRVLPDELSLALYDAKEALDAESAERWQHFADALGRFEPYSQGQVGAIYERARERARLVYETRSQRIPLELLGTGAQQLAAMIGHLVTTRASVIALEEPELNLRYDRQVLLREVLEAVVEGNQGPSQLFLASHSPAFGFGETFFALEAGERGPQVRRRPRSEAPIVTGYADCCASLARATPPEASAAQAPDAESTAPTP